jgi:hypothetical protein
VSEKEQRRSRRAPANSRGTASLRGSALPFQTRNISLGGSLIYMENSWSLAVGSRLDIWLRDLGFGAKARIQWLQRAEEGGTLLGLKFEELDFSKPPVLGDIAGRKPVGGSP